MNLSKEEKIIRLKRGIASPQTPVHLKEIMEADLKALEAPEAKVPVPLPSIPKKRTPPKKKAKKVAVKEEEPKPEPQPVQPTLTKEEKEARVAEYKARLDRKKAKKEEL